MRFVKIAAIFWFGLGLSFLLLSSKQSASARNIHHMQSTPTLESTREAAPALLLTPMPTDTATESPKGSFSALVATASLLMCTMVVMLAAGIGFAMLMVRLRTRRG